MIIALAGRRIDAHATAVPRFPLAKSSDVYKEVLALLQEQSTTAFVSSAACGADLLALQAAGQLGIERHIILPFSPERFRTRSVCDRPGAWGALFDQIIRDVEVAGHLELLNEDKEDLATFLHTNRVILNRAQTLARGDALPPLGVLAVIVWEGQSRGDDDMTADFAHEASARGLPVREISTR